ncbi:MAG: hypothetical protein LC624_05300 [Halobacteriales archaeon]|nr:hypothetical protein [Halobacteriales archaeon]
MRRAALIALLVLLVPGHASAECEDQCLPKSVTIVATVAGKVVVVQAGTDAEYCGPSDVFVQVGIRAAYCPAAE